MVVNWNILTFFCFDTDWSFTQVYLEKLKFLYNSRSFSISEHLYQASDIVFLIKVSKPMIDNFSQSLRKQFSMHKKDVNKKWPELSNLLYHLSKLKFVLIWDDALRNDTWTRRRL